MTTWRVMEDFQTGEETSFAVDEVSGIIKDVSILTRVVKISNVEQCSIQYAGILND